MKSSLTHERIEKLKIRLREHPIDVGWYDAYETFDAQIPQEELLSRTACEILKEIGKLE